MLGLRIESPLTTPKGLHAIFCLARTDCGGNRQYILLHAFLLVGRLALERCGESSLVVRGRGHAFCRGIDLEKLVVSRGQRRACCHRASIYLFFSLFQSARGGAFPLPFCRQIVKLFNPSFGLAVRRIVSIQTPSRCPSKYRVLRSWTNGVNCYGSVFQSLESPECTKLYPDDSVVVIRRLGLTCRLTAPTAQSALLLLY